MLQYYPQDWQGRSLYRDSHVLLDYGRRDHGADCLYDDGFSLTVSFRTGLFDLYRAKWHYRTIMSYHGTATRESRTRCHCTDVANLLCFFDSSLCHWRSDQLVVDCWRHFSVLLVPYCRYTEASVEKINVHLLYCIT